MKKTARITRCLVMALVVMLCFCACGSSAGHYELIRMETEGMSIDVAQMRETLGNGEMYLELNKDGTAILKMEMLGTYEALELVWEEGFIWTEGDEENKIPFTLEGKILTMEQNGQKLVFTKD